MLLRQIEYYCAVCRTSSFTKAAQEAGVSQSAVSQQVKALEKELGADLLQRNGHSFALTSAGEHFYRRATAILADLESLKSETTGIAVGRQSSLSVGYLSRYAGWQVSGAVAAFAARHPHVEISTVAAVHDDLNQLLATGKVDMVFNDKRGSFPPEFAARMLMSCRQYIEISETNALADEPSLRADQLSRMSCLLVGGAGSQKVERVYYRDILGFTSRMVVVATREEGRMLVAGNRGFMPVESREEQGDKGTVIRSIPLVDDAGNQVQREYFALWLKERETPLVTEFADILAELL